MAIVRYVLAALKEGVDREAYERYERYEPVGAAESQPLTFARSLCATFRSISEMTWFTRASMYARSGSIRSRSKDMSRTRRK